MQQVSHAATVLAAIEALPACNVSDARRRTGLGRRAFETALNHLVEAGSVHRISAGRGALLLPDQPEIEAFRDQVRVLRDPEVRRLHDHISATDVCSRTDVLATTETWGWGAHMTRWRLHTLEDAGLLQAILDLQDQRRILYRSLPVHPSAIEILERHDTIEHSD